MQSGNLNFLEPSGPLQACNGTALPFTYYLTQISNIIPKWFCLQENYCSNLMLFLLSTVMVQYSVYLLPLLTLLILCF